MELTQIGKLVADEWMRTEIVREYVIMDEWIIMPNHLHGILIIDRNDITTSFSCTLKPDSLGSIIGQFKSKATKKIKEEGFDYFGWQSRYYDHIIRTEKSLNRIRNYIHSNIANWMYDIENPNEISISEKRKFWKSR